MKYWDLGIDDLKCIRKVEICLSIVPCFANAITYSDDATNEANSSGCFRHGDDLTSCESIDRRTDEHGRDAFVDELNVVVRSANIPTVPNVCQLWSRCQRALMHVR